MSRRAPLSPDCALDTPPVPVRLGQIVSALSYALDLVEGQPPGHAVRSCLIGMRIAERIGLPESQCRALYFALLMKDAGCSSNATRMCQIVGGDEICAKAAVKTTDWTRTGLESVRYAWNYIGRGMAIAQKIGLIAQSAVQRKAQTLELVQIRCDRGATIALDMGLPVESAEAIRSLDEHWNGQGYPDGLRGEDIPLLARILNLSQTLEVYWRERSPDAAVEVACQRSKRWFDPAVVRAAVDLAKNGSLFDGLDEENAASRLRDLEPVQDAVPLTSSRIDDVCSAFAAVVDAKSPYTFRHSLGVASSAIAIARRMDLPETLQTMIRRAALLHDLGKLSVPNSILEKPGKLDADEWAIVRKHPYHTLQILQRIPGFQELAEVAAQHHEKLNGSGYWRGLTAERLSLPARLLAVADIYDALAAQRPYRESLPPDKVFEIIGRETPHALDESCVQALKETVYGGDLEIITSVRKLQSAIAAAEVHTRMPAGIAADGSDR